MNIRWSLLLVLACACSTEEEAPHDLIPRDRFKTLLIEAQLIEARANRGGRPDVQGGAETVALYDTLFREQGSTEAAFKSTYAWYVDHPVELKALLEEVVGDLKRGEVAADSTSTKDQ